MASQLVYGVLNPEQQPEQALIIPLHGYKGSREDLIPLARAVGPQTRIVAPESVNMVFEGRQTTGHMWYRMLELGHPEPGSVGDSLWQLEQFIYDLQDARQEGEAWPPLLLGYDQGAVMALMLALIMPDFLAGVIAIRGYLPDIRNWPIEAQAMNNLPVLLVSDPEDREFPRSLTDNTALQLSTYGANVSTQAVPHACTFGPELTPVIQQWFHALIAQERNSA
ncbi:MAG: hypothetical protein JWO42_1443 [Chloroflexi bacterium]|jgi:predicted esterase|nr:hypothetical protein [Chloroflexota bacterium]